MAPKFQENTENAEIIALKALDFLASDDEKFSYFLVTTGMDLAELKHKAGEPATLAGLLDHLLENESLLLEFATACQIAPEMIMRARHKLPGASHDS